MRTEKELNDRLEWASMEIIGAQIRLQQKTRVGGQKAIKSAQMEVTGLIMEINALEWALNHRTDEQSGYVRKES
jgi:hypothetical protein